MNGDKKYSLENKYLTNDIQLVVQPLCYDQDHPFATALQNIYNQQDSAYAQQVMSVSTIPVINHNRPAPVNYYPVDNNYDINRALAVALQQEYNQHSVVVNPPQPVVNNPPQPVVVNNQPAVNNQQVQLLQQQNQLLQQQNQLLQQQQSLYATPMSRLSAHSLLSPVRPVASSTTLVAVPRLVGYQAQVVAPSSSHAVVPLPLSLHRANHVVRDFGLF